MKRVELLEALYLQGKLMRELQVRYFSLRKGGGRFSSPEAKKVLEQSKLEELKFDKMVKELDGWWEKHAESPLAPGGGTENDIEDSGQWFTTDKVTPRSKLSEEDKSRLEEIHDYLFGPECADGEIVISKHLNDGDDDIRI